MAYSHLLYVNSQLTNTGLLMTMIWVNLCLGQRLMVHGAPDVAVHGLARSAVVVPLQVLRARGRELRVIARSLRAILPVLL